MPKSVLSIFKRLMYSLSKLNASQSIASLLNVKERALCIHSLTSDCDAFLSNRLGREQEGYLPHFTHCYTLFFYQYYFLFMLTIHVS